MTQLPNSAYLYPAGGVTGSPYWPTAPRPVPGAGPVPAVGVPAMEASGLTQPGMGAGPSMARPGMDSAGVYLPLGRQFPVAAQTTSAFPGTENVNPYQVFAKPGYNAPTPTKASGTTAPLVLVLVGIVFPIFGLIGTIMAAQVKSTLDGLYQADRKRCNSIMVLGICSTVIWALLIIVYVLIGVQ